MFTKPFKYEFSENGGYDAMSSAFLIKDSNDIELFNIDVASVWFWVGRPDEFPEDDTWEGRHRRDIRAEALAFRMVRGMNGLFPASQEEAEKYLLEQQKAEEDA